MMKKVKFLDPRLGHIIRALKVWSGTNKVFERLEMWLELDPSFMPVFWGKQN